MWIRHFSVLLHSSVASMHIMTGKWVVKDIEEQRKTIFPGKIYTGRRKSSIVMCCLCSFGECPSISFFEV